MKLFVLIVGLVLTAGATELRAEDSCVLVRRLAMNLGCGTIGSGSDVVSEQPNNDFVVSENFSSESCLMAKALDDVKRTQKSDCKKWTDEKRKELGKQYLTGNCIQNCSPCETTSLLKCTTVGSVHYRAGKVTP